MGVNGAYPHVSGAALGQHQGKEASSATDIQYHIGLPYTAPRAQQNAVSAHRMYAGRLLNAEFFETERP